MKKLFVLLLCLSTFNSWSQGSNDSVDVGYVRFLVDVDNGYFELVIDDTTYLKFYKAKLPVGHHKAKVWSPGYVTTEVEFDIEKDQTIDKFVPMAISNDRQEFEWAYKEYRMKFHKSFTVPLSISLGLAITSGVFMTSAYTLKNKIQSDIDLYHTAPSYSEAVFFKSNIEENNRRYNNRRIFFYTSLGLTAASVATTFVTYIKFKRNNTEPKLIAPSPFKDKFSMGISPFGCSFNWRFG